MNCVASRLRLVLLPVLLGSLAFGAGCGGESPSGTPPADSPAEAEDHDHGQAHAAAHGGSVVAVGDHVAHLEALHDIEAGDVRVWIADCDGRTLTLDTPPVLGFLTAQGSEQVEGEAVGDGWVFVHPELVGHPEKARFRVTIGGKSHTVELPHAHAHAAHGPHEGTVQPFHDDGGAAAGYVELKLHDDKGDLELWIATDEAITKPFDLPLAATVRVSFHDAAEDAVTLRVRNTGQNEGEDGQPNSRGGKTNYFIFPGDTGVDASWLRGADFAAEVTVTFEKDGVSYTTGRFELRPHTHEADHDHGH